MNVSDEVSCIEIFFKDTAVLKFVDCVHAVGVMLMELKASYSFV